MSKPQVVFFGSGPVAAKSLEMLVANFDVIAIVTKPKPEHHHGSFPVIDVADVHSLPVHFVRNKHQLSELIATNPFPAEVAILIDFGIIVGQDAIDYFPKGIINSHFSLLPEWRGADPISFAILSGQRKTGVSLMLLVEAMDEGPLLSQSGLELDINETTISLTEKLILESDRALRVIIPMWLNGETLERPQEEVTIADNKIPSYSRKLNKTDGELDFTKPADVLEREIRAFIEWPKSHTKLAEIDVIITQVSVADYTGKIGSIKIKDKQLIIPCSEKALVIERLKPAGKADMTAEAFIAGYGSRLD
ncbi:MAG: methionyl-tRNA formyltransferase [bacterium]|nr:methionyl-tRNA formyltransferase [bacterium]